MSYKRKPVSKPAAKDRSPAVSKIPRKTTKPPAPAKASKREPVTEDREGWLLAASEHLRGMVRAAQVTLGLPVCKHPMPAVSFGFPPQQRGSTSGSTVDHATGQTHIYISPTLGVDNPREASLDTVPVLEALLHEVIHDAVGHEHGHMGPFRSICDHLGTLGYADSKAGIRLANDLLRLVDRHLGPCPHKVVHSPAQDAPGHRRQRSRQRKYVCELCGQIIRAGSDHLTATHHCTDGRTGRFALAN